MYGYDPMQQIQQALMQQASFDPQTIEADEMTRAGMAGGGGGSPGGGGGGGGNGMGQAMAMGGQGLRDTYDIFTNKNEDGSTDFDWDTAKLAAEIVAMFSDRRLKKNIRKLSISNGINWYSYDYIWDEDGSGNIGVMADEVPHAAHMHPSGFLMVDYNKVI